MSPSPKPASCQACPLSSLGTGFVPADGPQGGVLLVGEAPGETEARLGKPFVGQAGYLLDRLLEKAGLSRDRFRVANTLCCRPPRNYLAGAPYEHRAIAECGHFLEAEIRQGQPKVIVALGNIALRRLTGVSGITRYRGYPLPGIGAAQGLWVVPTFHPSFLLPRDGQRDTAKLTGIIVLDLKKAVDIADHGYRRAATTYLLDPKPAEAAIWATQFDVAVARGEASWLSWDIETPGKLRALDEDDYDAEMIPADQSILRIAFSYRPGIAMSLPWRPEYLGVIKRLLEHPEIPQIVWNGYAFDCPIVAAHGIRITAPVWDGMWAWHLMQSDLPRGLESVTSHFAYDLPPWKHLSESEPAHYNAQDADAAGRCMTGILQELHTKGLWELYDRHVVRLFRFLHQAGRLTGVPVDTAAQDRLRAALATRRAALIRAAQALVPDSLKRVKEYARKPAEAIPTVPVEATGRVRVCATCGQQNVNRLHLRRCEGPIEQRLTTVTKHRVVLDWETLSDAEVETWIDEVGFNPNSTPQLIAYARQFHHPIGENYKTGSPQLDKTIRARLIKRFGERHPIYGVVQECQELTKTLGTYVDGFRPDRHGRIYTSYTFAPSSGRLSSRNVNLQNVSKHAQNRFSHEIRATIVPGPGKLFVEADSSAIEAVLTGFFMGSAAYVNAARLGIHDFVTCQELGLAFDPGLLKQYKADPAYAAARDRNKRIVHGTNYGMTPRKMVELYPGSFANERLAAEAQARYFAACPGLAEWQHAVRLTAHRQTWLQNPWGYRHYFYNVFQKGCHKAVSLGPDAKRAVAFLPQSSAAAFMKDSLLLLAESEWAQWAPANVTIHDAICLAVPEADVDRAVQFLAALMTRPIPELDGLQIGCEVQVGATWASMATVHTEHVNDQVLRSA